MTLPLVWLGILLSACWARGAGGAPIPGGPALQRHRRGRGLPQPVERLPPFRLLTGKEGMGYGDFKLLAALGAWLGWKMLLPIILIAAVGGRGGRHRHALRCRGRAARPRSPSAPSSPPPAGSC